MTVFFPTDSGWGLAVLGPSRAEDLPDGSWQGWEGFGEGFRPPTPLVCEDAEELAAALRSSYDRWQEWARGRERLNEHEGDLDTVYSDSMSRYRIIDGLDYLSAYRSFDRLAGGLTDLGVRIARRLRERPANRHRRARFRSDDS